MDQHKISFSHLTNDHKFQKEQTLPILFDQISVVDDDIKDTKRMSINPYPIKCIISNLPVVISAGHHPRLNISEK